MGLRQLCGFDDEAADRVRDLLAVGPDLVEVGTDGGVHHDIVDDDHQEGWHQQAVFTGHFFLARVGLINIIIIFFGLSSEK